jgi:hypothetical protein
MLGNIAGGAVADAAVFTIVSWYAQPNARGRIKDAVASI